MPRRRRCVLGSDNHARCEQSGVDASSSSLWSPAGALLCTQVNARVQRAVVSARALCCAQQACDRAERTLETNMRLTGGGGVLELVR